jgi:hypothetical protein
VSARLAELASALLVRDDAGGERYTFADDGERHLTTFIEASASVEPAPAFTEQVGDLLRLAVVLRDDEASPGAAATIERALHAAPTAVAALGLDRSPTEAVVLAGRSFAQFEGSSAPLRAPTLDAPAPEGSFKPPRPLKG